MLGPACAVFIFHKRATTEAPPATTATRRYCMKATSRASAPCASAITIMAVAAPGLEPHNTAVPGRICMRVIHQPSNVLTAMTANTPNTKIGQRLSISPAMDNGASFAIMQPMSPCARRNPQPGTRAVPPAAAIAIAANMGPSSRAAGIRTHSSTPPMAAEATRSAIHCAGSVLGPLTDRVRFQQGGAARSHARGNGDEVFSTPAGPPPASRTE